MEEVITRLYVKQLLRHPAFQLLLALLLIINAITIAIRTNSYLGQVGCWPDLYPNTGSDHCASFSGPLAPCLCVMVELVDLQKSGPHPGLVQQTFNHHAEAEVEAEA